jgi:hypothetical protein
MAGSEIEESAKAVQETAKATGKAIDASRELGGFLRAVFGGSLEQLGGMLEDSLLMHRGVRRLRLIRRYNEIRIEMGLPPDVTKPVSLKFGLPLIEAATLEDNEILQDMYARLLANATDPTSAIEAKRAFVSILQDCGPLEVRLLEWIYHAPGEEGFVRTARLPNEYLEYPPSVDSMEMPNPEVDLALSNLARLGCIEPVGMYGGGMPTRVVKITSLGRALIEACTTSRGTPAHPAGSSG